MIDHERIQRILRPVLLGFDETQRDSLERALEAIVGELATAAKPDAEPRVRIESIIQANPNSYLRLKPPLLGQSLQLPAPRKCQAGDWVEVSIEAPEGTLRVVALPYDDGPRGPRVTSTVNGLEFASFTVSGFVRFVTNGDDRWSSSTEFPAESAAARRIASNGAAGATGATGDTGEQGFPGRPGEPGMRGDRGYPGQPGPVGSDGRQGPPGMAGRWALPAMMIPGTPGAAGQQGMPGAPGMRGGPGERGYPGPPGVGFPGTQGPPGLMGMMGRPGPPGPPGRDGSSSSGGLTIRDNAATLLGSGVTELQGQDSATISENWAVVGASASISFDLIEDSVFPRYLGDATEKEDTGTGALTDPTKSADEEIIMFSGAAPVVAGVERGNTRTGGLLWTTYQGTGTARFDDNASITAANRFTFYGDKSVIIRDDELMGHISTDVTAGASTNRRWVCFTHRYPFCITSDMAHGDQIQFNGTDWLAQAFTQYGTSTGLPGLGDIRKGTAAVLNVVGNGGVGIQSGSGTNVDVTGASALGLTAGTVATLSGATGVQITANANNITLTSSGFILADGTLRVDSGTAAIGGEEQIAERTGGGPSSTAGFHKLWVDDTAPTQLRMVDDVGQDQSVGFAADGSLSNRTTTTPIPLTASATVLATQTYVANSLQAGATFHFFGQATFVRGATATAMNVTLEFRVGGVQVFAIAAVVMQTAASTHQAWIEGQFTVQAAPGAAANCSVSGWFAHDIGTAATVVEGIMTAAPNNFTAATNGSLTLDIRAFASASVASTSVTPIHGYIQRIK